MKEVAMTDQSDREEGEAMVQELNIRQGIQGGSPDSIFPALKGVDDGGV